jgi:hypothetical protein
VLFLSGNQIRILSGLEALIYMGTAMQFVFPAAILGSLILASFGYSVMARVPLEDLQLNLTQETGPDEIAITDSLDTADRIQAEEAGSGRETESVSAKCQISDRYPPEIRQWCELITKQANRHNLDPDLLAALIWQESGGNPTAYSRSGAVGLMQVMPRDGLAASFNCVNGPCFASRPSIQELQEPQFNVKYGTGMLAGLVKKYGDTRDALKSYGPMDVGYYYADQVLGIFENYNR